jgi:Terminase RNaseH-like domain
MDTLDRVHIGIDLGQVKDPTAICVAKVEQVWRGRGRDVTDKYNRVRKEKVFETEYTAHFLERLPLGTSYPDVAKRIVEILKNPLLLKIQRQAYIDITGVGRPVFQMVEEACKDEKDTYNVILKPISFTSGKNYDREKGSLGKAYLVSRMQALLQEQLVHAPDTPEARATLEELRVYEIKVDDDGKDTYGAKTGKHDDLATCLGLACLEDPAMYTAGYFTAPYGSAWAR